MGFVHESKGFVADFEKMCGNRNFAWAFSIGDVACTRDVGTVYSSLLSENGG